MRKTAFFTIVAFFISAAFLHSQQAAGSARSITVLYDNYSSKEGLSADWGFSCLIRGSGKTILFDAGAKPGILRNNMERLGIDPASIELFALSHMHYDHADGLPYILEKNGGMTAFIPARWPEGYERRIFGERARVRRIDGFERIDDGVHLTGGLGTSTVEQALVLETAEGLVVVTGCSHPGIVSMIERVRQTFGKNVFMVLGGFHLLNHTDDRIESIIAGLKALGVKKCGATHCTGEPAIRLFRAAFGENYVEAGAGRTIMLPGPDAGL